MKKNINNLLAIAMNLQLFAEAGSTVNATGSMVNAYTGATTAYDGNGFNGELKTFYDTELLENARAEMFYAQFAKKQVLPANHGVTVEWRKFNTFDRATQLQEGVIPTGQQFGMSYKTGVINQYGTYTAVTDKLEMRAYDDVILAATEEMGASAAETQEVLIRDALLTNGNVLYCDNITLDTGAVASATPTSPDMMEATTTVMSVLTPAMVAKAVTKMKKDRVPKINGKYVAVIHPSVAHDLRNHKDWVEAHKYAATTEIFNGEIGELHGCRFVEDNFAPVLGGEDYKNKAGTVTYATYFFGKDAFGIIDPAEGGLQMIVKNKEVAGGPLNQFSTIGYKFETNGATILYTERVLRVMSCSSFSGIDEAN
jgi:N4-gp56 family major capsid protein